jgi:hypothetical protein
MVTRCSAADPMERESFGEILSDLERIQFQVTPGADGARARSSA